MGHILTLNDLQKHFEQARDKLTRDRQEIFAFAPLPEGFDRDRYSFSYFQAERIGLEVITASLKDVAWLPMQLDAKSEIVLKNKSAVKKWLGSSLAGQPDGGIFGNDFIHALTRAALIHGWNSPSFRALAVRIGNVFHDLSCLIGLIYYGVWMSENGVEGLSISNPDDLERTAQEIAALTRSPEIAMLLKRRRIAKESAARKQVGSPKKRKPVLRIVPNDDSERTPPTVH